MQESAVQNTNVTRRKVLYTNIKFGVRKYQNLTTQVVH